MVQLGDNVKGVGNVELRHKDHDAVGKIGTCMNVFNWKTIAPNIRTIV